MIKRSLALLLIMFMLSPFYVFMASTTNAGELSSDAVELPSDTGELPSDTGELPSDADEAGFTTASKVYYSSMNYTSQYDTYYGIPYCTEAGGKKDFLCGGFFCVAYDAGDYLKISVFDEEMNFSRSLTLDRELENFGAAAGDEDGNIYVLWGAYIEGEDSNARKQVNLKLVKYDCQTGKKLGAAEYISGDGYSNGTKSPFAYGNASIAISGDRIAAHFGRLMFRSGDGRNHQSSTVVYADKNTMRPLTLPVPYVSHSFDQQAIATRDGGFLFADHGDAYPRAFVLSYVGAKDNAASARYDGRIDSSIQIFHFTSALEGTGASAGYAYNHTFAQMGGIAETDSAYVFAASSVREPASSLPIDAGPRDVFIQVLKKDLRETRNRADMYLVSGEGTARSGFDRDSNRFTDYGVIWLTRLSKGEYALSPKIAALENDTVAVFWEVFKESTDDWGYSSYNFTAAYFAVVDARTGSMLTGPEELPGVRLPAYDRPVLLNGKIIWSLAEQSSIYTEDDSRPGSLKIISLDFGTQNKQEWLNPYEDVADSDWFFNYVRFTSENALMNGVSETVFNHGGSLTRAMAAAALYRLAGSPVQGYSPVFTDVPDEEWYTSAIMWAFGNGIITGYGNSRFGPDDRITREQLSVMLHRFELLANGGNTPRFAKYTNWFYDADKISAWAADAMTWAVSTGLISGMNAYELNPGGNATRAQFAAILTRYMSRI